MPIRPANVQDIPNIAKAHVRSWQTSYKGQVPQSYLDRLSVADREVAWSKALSHPPHHMLVAEHEGSIIGFVSFGPSRDEDVKGKEGIGEIYAIYLVEEHKGQGIGKDLLKRAEEELKNVHFQEASLWVLESNAKARSFYQRQGYTSDGQKMKTDFDGQEAWEIRYRKSFEK